MLHELPQQLVLHIGIAKTTTVAGNSAGKVLAHFFSIKNVKSTPLFPGVAAFLGLKSSVT